MCQIGWDSRLVKGLLHSYIFIFLFLSYHSYTMPNNIWLKSTFINNTFLKVCLVQYVLAMVITNMEANIDKRKVVRFCHRYIKDILHFKYHWWFTMKLFFYSPFCECYQFSICKDYLKVENKWDKLKWIFISSVM